MKLIRDGMVCEPDWLLIDKLDSGRQNAGKVVPFDVFISNREIFQDTQTHIGVLVKADSNIEILKPFPESLKLVAIEFLTFADGRGFSLAHRLHRSFDYRGGIWASGHPQ